VRMRTNAKESAVTVATARAQFKAMLANARSLDHMTPESLVRSYRLSLKEIEYELTIAKQKRAAQ